MISTLHPTVVNPPASAAALRRLQEAVGVALPEELRELLSMANGVSMPDVLIESFRCPQVPGGGIGGNRLFSVDEVLEARAIYSGRVASDLLVFGDDDFGNALCIGVKGRRKDAVYFWDHEGEVSDARVREKQADPEAQQPNEYFVARTLSSFLSLFTRRQDDES